MEEDNSRLVEENKKLRQFIAHQARKSAYSNRQLLLSETRIRKLDAYNKRLGKKAVAYRVRSARNAKGSYIVLGGERMRLVMMQEMD